MKNYLLRAIVPFSFIIIVIGKYVIVA